MSRPYFLRFAACFCLTLGMTGALPRPSNAQVTALQPFKDWGETIGVAIDPISNIVVANQKHGPLYTRGIYTIPYVWTPDPDANAQTATPLATLSPNRSTNATAVSSVANGALAIVGYGFIGTTTVIHACMWTGTPNANGGFDFSPPVDLGTLGGQFSYAYGVNSAGEIVGSASTGSAYRAYVLIPGVSMTALPLINPSTLGQRYGQSR